MRTFSPEVEDALIQSQDSFVWEALLLNDFIEVLFGIL